MSTILIPLQAPLQSWGLRSRWTHRDTALAPTKSGVIGLIANAMGLDRNDPITMFDGLRFGVRVDQPGIVLTDFQVSGRINGNVITPKDYLADAKFLAGFETSDDKMLDRISTAFRNPARPLYLGRRNCPPLGPIIPTILNASLEDSLQEAPSLNGKPTNLMPLEIEPASFTKDSIPVNDQPTTFNRKSRGWTSRPVLRITPETNPYITAALDTTL